MERLEQLPGVRAAAMVNSLPLEGGIDMIFNIPRRPPANGQKFNGDVQWRFVSAHYFYVLGIPLRGPSVPNAGTGKDRDHLMKPWL